MSISKKRKIAWAVFFVLLAPAAIVAGILGKRLQ